MSHGFLVAGHFVFHVVNFAKICTGWYLLKIFPSCKECDICKRRTTCVLISSNCLLDSERSMYYIFSVRHLCLLIMLEKWTSYKYSSAWQSKYLLASFFFFNLSVWIPLVVWIFICWFGFVLFSIWTTCSFGFLFLFNTSPSSSNVVKWIKEVGVRVCD